MHSCRSRYDDPSIKKTNPFLLFIFINRLSAKDTNGVMKQCPSGYFLRQLLFFCYLYLREPMHYRTRGGEWWGRIAATPHFYMLSAVRKGINEWRIQVARKLISSEVVSNSPDGQSTSAPKYLLGGNYACLKSFYRTAADSTSTKHGSLPASVLPMRRTGQCITRIVSLPSQRDCWNCRPGLPNITVRKSAWNRPASIGSQCLTSLKRPATASLLIRNTQSPKKVTRRIARTPNGSVISSCVG